MTKTIKVALAGAGAFGLKHLDGIKLIDGVEVVSLVGRDLDKTREEAAKYGVGHVTTDLAETPEAAGTRCGDPGDADRRCTPRRRSSAWKRASTCRSRFRSPTA